jgi:hypothetical protein
MLAFAAAAVLSPRELSLMRLSAPWTDGSVFSWDCGWSRERVALRTIIACRPGGACSGGGNNGSALVGVAVTVGVSESMRRR